MNTKMIERLRAEFAVEQKRREEQDAKEHAEAEARKKREMAAGRQWAETEATLKQLSKLYDLLRLPNGPQHLIAQLDLPPATLGITRDFIQGAYDAWHEVEEQVTGTKPLESWRRVK
jgi:hypothetical protein